MAALGLVSREPTCSCFWYFLRMDSLWYFQNCLVASLPATLVRTERRVGLASVGDWEDWETYSSCRPGAHLGTW